uniref:Uncharacterized protein n=1 Tax=Arundo donax TaxID=35708 RepID=A0A0A9EJA4_ARUDO
MSSKYSMWSQEQKELNGVTYPASFLAR